MANPLQALVNNPKLLETYLNVLGQGQAYAAQGQAQNAAMTQAQNQSALVQQMLGEASARDLEARQANENRYMDILQLLGITRNDVLADVNQFGQSIVNDTNQNFDRARNNALADLAARGLSGSTIRQGVEETNARERSAAQLRNQDALLSNRSAANERTAGNIAGVMERRTDTYPDSNQLANLALQYGMAGGNMFLPTPNPSAAPVGTPRAIGTGLPTAPQTGGVPRPVGVGLPPGLPAPATGGVPRSAAAYGSVASAPVQRSTMPVQYQYVMRALADAANQPRYVGTATQGGGPVSYRNEWGKGVVAYHDDPYTRAQYGVTTIPGPFAGYAANIPQANLAPAMSFVQPWYNQPVQPRQPVQRTPYRRPSTRGPYVGDVNYQLAAGLV